MVSTEEILITMLGQNQVSPVTRQITNDVESMASTINNSTQGMFSGLNAQTSSLSQGIGSTLGAMNTGMMSLSSVSRQVMGELGSTKSAMDWVYGTTSKEDTNKVLVSNMAKTQEEYESLYGTIDKVTDSSLTSMQDLIPALNAFRSATQATAGELEKDVTEDMANFGAFVLAQTGSTQLALTAMMDLSKGIKGRYASLDQYGVSAEALKATGKWKEAEGGSKTKNWTGDENDIKGYMDAVTEVIGDTEALMDTNEGLNAQMGKMWSRAGKRIGHEMMPGLKSLKQTFIELDEELDGNLSTAVLRVALGIEELQQKMYQFNTLYDGFVRLSDVARILGSRLGLIKPVQDANNTSLRNNTRRILENNSALEENNLLRLGNAEATGAMNMALDGQNMGDVPADMVQQTATDTVSDTLADNALYFTQGTAHDALVDKAFSKGDNKGSDKDTELIRQEGKSILNQIDAKKRNQTSIRELGKVAENVQRDKEAIDIVGGAIGHVSNPQAFMESVEKAEGFENFEEKVANRKLDAVRRSGAMSQMPKSIYDADTMRQISEASAPKNFTTLIRSKLGSAGTTLQNTLEKGFGGIGDGIRKGTGAVKKINLSNIKTSVNGLSTNIHSAFSSIGTNIRKINLTNITSGFRGLTSRIGGVFTGGLSSLNQSLGNFASNFNLKESLSKISASVKGTSAVTGGMATELATTATEMGAIATETGAVATGAGVASAEAQVAGVEMTTASTGFSIMGMAEMGLTGALYTLLVPTIAISVVIMILIPIIAGIVAEVLLFVALLGQFMQALNFDAINVDGVAEKIQQIATAIAWVGVAMASMSFVGIMSGIAIVTNGLSTLMGGGLDGAIRMLQEVGAKLQAFSSITIDDSIPASLENISNTLGSVSKAMQALTSVAWDTGFSGLISWVFRFKDVGSALDQAKDEIVKASSKLQEFSAVTPIDDATAQKIQNVCDSLGSVGKAMEGLRSIRDSQNLDFNAWVGGLFGNANIQTALLNVKQDIIDASRVLNQFSGVSQIDESIATKLKTVADTLSSVGDALKSLRSIRDDGNWDSSVGQIFGNRDIVTPIQNAKEDLIRVSKVLTELKAVPEMPKGLDGKLKNVATTLNGISTALTNMSNIQQATVNIDFSKMEKSIDDAKTTIANVSKKLSEWKISSPPDISKDMKGLSTILSSISTSISAMNKISVASTTFDPTTVETNIGKSKELIEKVAKDLSDWEISDIGNKGEQIKKVTTAINSLKDTTVNLKDFPVVSGDEIPNRVNKAVTVIQMSARHINTQLSGLSFNESSTSIITKVSSALGVLKNSTNNLKDFPIVSGDEIPKRVDKATTVIQNSARHMSRLNGQTLGDNVSTVISRTGSAGNTLKTAVNNLKGFPIVSGDEIPKRVDKAVTVIQNSARHISRLNGGANIGENVNSIISRTGSNSQSLKTAINKMKGFPIVSGNEIPNRVNKAVTAVRMSAVHLNKLKGTQLTAQIGSLATKVSTAVTQLKATVNNLKGGFKASGVGIGSNLKIGIGTGLNGLSSVVSSKVSQAGATGKTYAGTYGKGIGFSMTNGFTTNLKLSNAMSTEMGHVVSAVDNGIAEAKTHAQDGASEIVQAFQDGVNVGSPGDIARTMSTEMNYTNEAITGSKFMLKTSSRNIAQAIVQGFGNPISRLETLNKMDANYNRSRLETVRNMNQRSNMGKKQRPVNISVGEGAVQLDARNMTTKESRQIMINALEGLDMVSGIEVSKNI